MGSHRCGSVGVHGNYEIAHGSTNDCLANGLADVIFRRIFAGYAKGQFGERIEGGEQRASNDLVQWDTNAFCNRDDCNGRNGTDSLADDCAIVLFLYFRVLIGFRVEAMI